MLNACIMIISRQLSYKTNGHTEPWLCEWYCSFWKAVVLLRIFLSFFFGRRCFYVYSCIELQLAEARTLGLHSSDQYLVLLLEF